MSAGYYCKNTGAIEGRYALLIRLSDEDRKALVKLSHDRQLSANELIRVLIRKASEEA